MGVAPRNRANPALVAEQAERAFELKARGWTYARIAAELGVGVSTVHSRIHHAADKRLSPKIDHYRAVMDQQIDEAESHVMAIVEDPTIRPELRLAAIDRWGRLLERRAKLHGLDAPVRLEGTVTHKTQQDAELEALFGALDAANAEQAARLDTPA